MLETDRIAFPPVPVWQEATHGQMMPPRRRLLFMPKQLPFDELTYTLARVKDLLLTQEKVDRAVQLLAEGIRDAFPGSLGAGVSLLDGQGRRTSTGATDAAVLQADLAQYTLGQGPCLTAWATGRTVLIHEVAVDGRWPLWSRAVVGLPVRSVISSPLMAETKCLGAIKIYSAAPGTYEAANAGPLERFAAPAALLLDSIQDSGTPRRFSGVLTTALEHRDTVNRALGMLMERHQLTAGQAFQKLLHLARTRRRPLAGLCSDIMTGVTTGIRNPG